MEDNFYSINKMIELGMSLALSQQMVKIINDSINTVKIQGTIQNFVSLNAYQFYVVINGNQQGPISTQDILNLIQEKKIDKQTLIWKPGMQSWETIEKVSEVLNLFSMIPPPLPTNTK